MTRMTDADLDEVRRRIREQCQDDPEASEADVDRLAALYARIRMRRIREAARRGDQ